MSISTALAALHAAVEAIRRQPDVVEVSAESDGDSGEIIFTTADGSSYILRLQSISDVG